MIQIQNLYKTYNENTVLENISLQVKRSEIFGIVGQSGVGKSTLLRCINGLENFEQGRIIVNDTDIATLAESELLAFRRKIGMIFQNFALLNRKTVLDNVMLPMECWKYPREVRQKKASELLELVGLGDKTAALPHELSGGQKQRVAIARALTLEPDILLCDEATSALDPAITASILELLAAINRSLGITIVLVTHDMAVIKAICNRMAIVADKRIAALGDVAETFLAEPPCLLDLLGKKELVTPPGRAILRLSLRDAEREQAAVTRLMAALTPAAVIIAANVEPLAGRSCGHLHVSIPLAELERARTCCIAEGIACAVAESKGGERNVL